MAGPLGPSVGWHRFRRELRGDAHAQDQALLQTMAAPVRCLQGCTGMRAVLCAQGPNVAPRAPPSGLA